VTCFSAHKAYISGFNFQTKQDRYVGSESVYFRGKVRDKEKFFEIVAFDTTSRNGRRDWKKTFFVFLKVLEAGDDLSRKNPRMYFSENGFPACSSLENMSCR
jgi:hypothetical protein